MMQDIEWINERAQRAKRRGDYETFESWRVAYLNAQAVQRREKFDNQVEKSVTQDEPTN